MSDTGRSAPYDEYPQIRTDGDALDTEGLAVIDSVRILGPYDPINTFLHPANGVERDPDVIEPQLLTGTEFSVIPPRLGDLRTFVGDGTSIDGTAETRRYVVVEVFDGAQWINAQIVPRPPDPPRNLLLMADNRGVRWLDCDWRSFDIQIVQGVAIQNGTWSCRYRMVNARLVECFYSYVPGSNDVGDGQVIQIALPQDYPEFDSSLTTGFGTLFRSDGARQPISIVPTTRAGGQHVWRIAASGADFLHYGELVVSGGTGFAAIRFLVQYGVQQP